MNDFTPLNIPPREIGKAEPGKPDSTPSGPKPDAAEFQNQLKQALGGMIEDVSHVQNASPQTMEDIQKAMDAAKNAFSNSMQAHELMQSLLGDVAPKPDSEANPEEKPE